MRGPVANTLDSEINDGRAYDFDYNRPHTFKSVLDLPDDTDFCAEHIPGIFIRHQKKY